MTEKERRNLDILDTIRRRREVSRADISKLTGRNIVTVSNYVNTYLKRITVTVTWGDSFGNNNSKTLTTLVADHY